MLGWPVEHSASPAMHNAAFRALGIDAVFVALGVKPELLELAIHGMSATQALGLSITIPHKAAALGLCTDVDQAAAAIGAVNCIAFRDSKIRGYNTDAAGFVDALRHADIELKGARAVLLGGGGAARAVCHGLEQQQVVCEVVARTPSKVSWRKSHAFSELPGLLESASLLVDCTATGLTPTGLSSLPAPVPLDRLRSDATVVSLVYHREPELLAQARARHLRVVDGSGMLAFQGARAFEIWTGQKPPIDVMLAAIKPA